MTPHDVRALALALPEAHEEDHHGRPSFRVADKIFATLPDGEHVNVMLGPEECDAALAAHPEAVQELWWGKRRAGVSVGLAGAGQGLLEPLLREAWRRRAPRKLLRLLGEL